jgi:hypothetical protein
MPATTRKFHDTEQKTHSEKKYDGRVSEVRGMEQRKQQKQQQDQNHSRLRF